MILRTVFNISVIQRPASGSAQNSCEPGSNNGVKQQNNFSVEKSTFDHHDNRSESWGPEGDSWCLLGWTRKETSSKRCWCRGHVCIFGKERHKAVFKCWLVVCFNFFLLLSPPSTSFYGKPKTLALYSSINSRKFVLNICSVSDTMRSYRYTSNGRLYNTGGKS